MCGIAGIVGGPPPDREVLEAMAAEMAHRGPDGQRVWTDGAASLAFRRLAIIDLDERSMQPQHLGPWHLVFNGEIYNYRELRDELRGRGSRFSTEGDAEVLLHAWATWGPKALDRLDGMFAFAVWNAETRALTLACDPFGEKPLYWSARDGQLVFASDIRAILRARPELGAPRLSALAPFLGRGLMPPVHQSFFDGIARLPGGHTLTFANGVATVHRAWAPRRVEVPANYGDAVATLRTLLEQSVRLRLRSDVPVGTSLSGGIDSSAVVGLCAALSGDHDRHAFTARFPGFARDEWHHASAVAQAANVARHHAVEPTAAGALADLDGLVASQEEPFGSLSIYAQWCVMRAAREAGVTVVLDGQGADEIFGGYVGANGWALRSMGAAAVVRGLLRPDDRRAVALALGADALPRPLRIAYRTRTVTPYATAAVARAAAATEPPRAEPGARGPLERELLRQTLHTSLPQLLRYADRSSMAQSREVRLPFLSRAVAEFGLSLPASYLYRDGLTKAVLRDAVRGLVPESILARRDKVGYEPPQAQWLCEPAWVERIRETLLDPAVRVGELVDRGRVETDARQGRWRDPAGIWRALCLELWLRAFEVRP